jgi:hypothetical protein
MKITWIMSLFIVKDFRRAINIPRICSSSLCLRRLSTGPRLIPPGLKNEQIQEITVKWVKKWVFGLNLCPWSGKLLADQKLKVVVNRSKYFEDIAENVINEIKLLLPEQPSSAGPSTTLVVLPALQSFRDFLDVCHALEEMMESNSTFANQIQIANFHPKYQFDNTRRSDVENYTNRSPFPMIHLLKMDDVSNAVASCKEGNTDFIWQRNIDLMKQMGVEKVKKVQEEIVTETLKQKKE